MLAQPAAPPIGPLVLDLRITFPTFPTDKPQLASSRYVNPADLPGVGKGLDVGAHVFVFKWKAVTFGIGANIMTGRSHTDALVPVGSPTPTPTPTPTPIPGVKPTPTPTPAPGQAVTERLRTIAPQLSFNFGN